jgi:hypothetical protein
LRAASESLAREERLDEARVEQWKAWQRLRRFAPQSQPSPPPRGGEGAAGG